MVDRRLFEETATLNYAGYAHVQHDSSFQVYLQKVRPYDKYVVVMPIALNSNSTFQCSEKQDM